MMPLIIVDVKINTNLPMKNSRRYNYTIGTYSELKIINFV